MPTSFFEQSAGNLKVEECSLSVLSIIHVKIEEATTHKHHLMMHSISSCHVVWLAPLLLYSSLIQEGHFPSPMGFEGCAKARAEAFSELREEQCHPYASVVGIVVHVLFF